MGESDICFNKFTHHFKKISPFNTESISDVRVIILCYTSIHLQTITVQGVRWFWPFLDCVNVLR